MILVKIRNGDYEGIINLEFVKTMYIDSNIYEDEFIIKAIYGSNDCTIIGKYKKKEEACNIMRLISKAVDDDVKVIYLNQGYKYKDGEE